MRNNAEEIQELTNIHERLMAWVQAFEVRDVEVRYRV
jgi:hypothetical protein